VDEALSASATLVATEIGFIVGYYKRNMLE
jgi:hypothetical protein